MSYHHNTKHKSSEDILREQGNVGAGNVGAGNVGAGNVGAGNVGNGNVGSGGSSSSGENTPKVSDARDAADYGTQADKEAFGVDDSSSSSGSSGNV